MVELFPSPRSIHWGESNIRFSGEVTVVKDPTLPSQGYELHIQADNATLTHADDAGLRYGMATVEQLRSDGKTLPTVHIVDSPDITTRGYMLDVSRDRVPTRQTLERLVSILTLARYNHLQLYFEHTFAYADHEDVWRDASPITPEDLRWLDDLCHANGIELVANQNCFGHMGRWLALDRYRDMADSPDGAEVASGFIIPPTVLEPTQENAAFAVGLVREQMGYLRSDSVNINCDETFELGRGRSRARAEQIGTTAVYVEHLNRVVGPLLDDGKSVLFWGDVIAHDKDRISELPSAEIADGDLSALVWNYDAPDAPTPPISPGLAKILSELGIDLESPTDFATRVEPFIGCGVPFWVAPGTSTWQSFVGRWDNARANLVDAALVGRDSGASGYLVTDWGDNGHHQPPSVSDLPALYGGAVSWCTETNADIDMATISNALVYGDETGLMGRAIESIGTIAHATGRFARNVSPIFAAAFPHQMHLIGGEATLDKVTASIKVLDDAAADIAASHPTCADSDVLREELLVAIGMARHGLTRIGIEVGLEDPGAAVMARELADLIERYRSVWLERSRPGGLTESLAHLESTLKIYQVAQ